MQTRLFFYDPSKNLDVVKKRLKQKYKSIDELSIEVQKRQCNSPESVDDYMLWQALTALEKGQNEQPEGVLNEPQQVLIKYKEEIIYHTSDFYQILTPRRMELLEYINSHNLKSVKSLAADLKRDYKNVYDDLLALQRYRLIEFIREGKNKHPVSRLTGIEVILGK